jgi:predicted nucleic acid-binding protein
MTLIDTSVWVDHLRRGNAKVRGLLESGEVAIHPFVLGELACGNMKNRKEILDLLGQLPNATVAEQNEVLALVESRKLFGTGIGWVDAHLLASALISGTRLLTMDKALGDAALLLDVRAE